MPKLVQLHPSRTLEPDTTASSRHVAHLHATDGVRSHRGPSRTHPLTAIPTLTSRPPADGHLAGAPGGCLSAGSCEATRAQRRRCPACRRRTCPDAGGKQSRVSPSRRLSALPRPQPSALLSAAPPSPRGWGVWTGPPPPGASGDLRARALHPSLGRAPGVETGGWQRSTVCWRPQLCRISRPGTAVLPEAAQALQRTTRAQPRTQRAPAQPRKEQEELVQTESGAHAHHRDPVLDQCVQFGAGTYRTWAGRGQDFSRPGRVRLPLRAPHPAPPRPCAALLTHFADVNAFMVQHVIRFTKDLPPPSGGTRCPHPHQQKRKETTSALWGAVQADPAHLSFLLPLADPQVSQREETDQGQPPPALALWSYIKGRPQGRKRLGASELSLDTSLSFPLGSVVPWGPLLPSHLMRSSTRTAPAAASSHFFQTFIQWRCEVVAHSLYHGIPETDGLLPLAPPSNLPGPAAFAECSRSALGLCPPLHRARPSIAHAHEVMLIHSFTAKAPRSAGHLPRLSALRPLLPALHKPFCPERGALDSRTHPPPRSCSPWPGPQIPNSWSPRQV
ncbi:nuclear receptor subfamily 1 group I member 3 [Pteronotus mesoamericanus]|uniref:nuclear receptor subfamily 1 group I member 3 n=1 Tax=Pteronotus mesoamericanus TaxID=1884717 RepID=UPI0023EC7716|nr:nuclear receptor subfamily 1 group I member 3 [Pteronotus parnellii mesoamericanus]